MYASASVGDVEVAKSSKEEYRCPEEEILYSGDE